MNDSVEDPTRQLAESNANLLSRNYEVQPLLSYKREFPRDCALEPTTEEEIMYTRDVQEYEIDPTVLPQQPDPWKFENELYSAFWEGGMRDEERSLACTEAWFGYINVPITTLFIIRALLNNIIDTIEIRGFMTPVGLLKNFGDFLAKNWPNKIPVNPETGRYKISEEFDMTNMVKSFQLEFQNDLSLRTQMVLFNKYFTRRDNYSNWCKFASLMSTLASELGPISHNLCNETVEKIDNIVAYQRLCSRDYATWTNEYKNEVELWAQNMFIIPRTFKLISGNLVLVKIEKSTRNNVKLNKILRIVTDADIQANEPSSSESVLETVSLERDENNNIIEPEFEIGSDESM
jgi:hypothetical protein